MSVTIEYHEGAVTYISDAGREKLADEQRNTQAEILVWTTAASCMAIAGLVLKQILGN